jgi:hypothetical protein
LWQWKSGLQCPLKMAATATPNNTNTNTTTSLLRIHLVI